MEQNNTQDIDQEDGIYSRAAKGVYSIPPELSRLKKTGTSTNLNWIVNRDAAGVSLENWQSDPSRIIQYEGAYHLWMIDLDRKRCAEARWWDDPGFFETPEGRDFRPDTSRILYLSSEDTHRWTAHGHLHRPLQEAQWESAHEGTRAFLLALQTRDNHDPEPRQP